MRFHHLLRVVLLVCLCGLGGIVLAQTWDGDTNGNWGTGTNWSGDVMPGPAGNVVIDNGGLANQPQIAAGDAFSAGLVGVSAGALQVAGTLTSPITVSGGLTGGRLEILSSGVINGAVSNSGRLDLAGTVVGNLNLLSGLASITSGAVVTGTSNLDAALFVDLVGLSFGADELVYDVFMSDAFVGEFDSIATAGLADGYLVSTRFGKDGNFDVFQLVLTKAPLEIPEPSTLAMCLFALGACRT